MENHRAHILILSSWYPTNDRPFLGNFVERQVALLGTKYKISIIQSEEDPSVKKIQTKKTQSGSLEQIKVLYPKRNFKLSRKLIQKKAFLKGLKSLSKVDLIIGNILLPNGWQFVVAKNKFNCPLLYIEHGSYFRANSTYKWRGFDRLILKSINNNADEVIAVSDFLRQDLKKHFPFRDIKVIGNHVDIDLFSLKNSDQIESKSFLHVSTLDRDTKNPEGIIQACLLLKEQIDDFKLTIVSDEDYSSLVLKVKNLGLEKNIFFIGPLDWSELPPHYQKAAAFILFSEYETFSIVLAEAWATGTPVISTEVGIASELSPFIGTSVNQNDSEGLAKAMLAIIENNKFNSPAIRDHAMQYSAESILNKWITLINKHLG